jgi:RHS repeat-associated protein
VQFFSNAAPGSLTRTLAYTYDPLGRRASKTDNGSVQRFVYDGDDLVGTLDAANAVAASNVFSGAIDEPLASTTGGLAKSLYANHLGSVMAVADGSSLTHAYRYSPYGETVAPSSADSTPFRYTGREKDTDSLYYYRSRYYNTAVKSFAQSDPTGLAGGINGYSYVGATPVNVGDPDGTSWITKSVKWVVQGGKKVGIIPKGTIATKSAVAARKAGKDCIVIAKNEEEALRRAKEIERAAHPDGDLLHHPKDAHIRNGNQPHVQTAGIKGHTFYKFMSAFAFTTYLGDGFWGQAADFLNPLSIPKDVMDIYDDLAPSGESCECGA